MIIVDTALAKRVTEGRPINIGIIGAGYSGRNVAHQILTAAPGIRVAAIANRTIEKAQAIYMDSVGAHARSVSNPDEVSDAIAANEFVVTDDARHVCEASGIEAIVEATGTVDYGARVVTHALDCSKHVILMNVELDATVGSILKAKADRAKVIYTNTDGDEPGVAMNMYRFVKAIGLTPVVAGNLKGLYDPYRNPDTQREFARTHGQKPATMAHFADGTKLSMELTVLANATGFGVAKRGMHGPHLDHVNDGAAFYADRLITGGMVEFLVGTPPGNGAFVVGRTEDPVRKEYLKYLKMGDGPLYVFYTPFHLPHLEVPATIGRAVLLHDATVAPLGAPSCDAVAVAKRDLAPGDRLDGCGGFATYALIENHAVALAEGLLPMGISDGATVRRKVAVDTALTYNDVELPKNFGVQLRREQDAHFGSLAENTGAIGRRH